MKSFKLNRRSQLCKDYGFRWGIEFDNTSVASLQRLQLKEWAHNRYGAPHGILWGRTVNPDSVWYYGPSKPYTDNTNKNLLWVMFKDPKLVTLAMLMA